MSSTNTRRIISAVAALGYLVAILTILVPGPAVVFFVAVGFAVVAEFQVQRTSELGIALFRRDLDERQEAQRAQLLAASYRTVIGLTTVGVVIVALLGEPLLWRFGRQAVNGAAWLSGVFAWLLAGALVVLVLLPGHVAAWRAPAATADIGVHPGPKA